MLPIKYYNNITGIIFMHLVNAFIQCIQDLHFITSYIPWIKPMTLPFVSVMLCWLQYEKTLNEWTTGANSSLRFIPGETLLAGSQNNTEEMQKLHP